MATQTRKGKGSKTKAQPRTKNLKTLTQQDAELQLVHGTEIELYQQELKDIPKDPKTALRVISLRKKTMLQCLIKCLGVVTKASRMCGISRRTHVYWCNTDEFYNDAVKEIKEVVVDFYEDALQDLVRERNPAAVIFALKTQGKKRGYIETVHNMNQAFDDNNVHVFINDNGRDTPFQDANVV